VCGAGGVGRDEVRVVSMDVVLVLLIAVVGFLIGGVYTTYKTAKITATVLSVAALLAAGGAVAWYVS
jgi:hypothetical protein